MSIEISVKDFCEINLYNHKNIEKVMSSVVNESANGVLVSLFEDKAVLFDNIKKKFYYADYVFNKTGFVFENFNEIILKKNEKEFSRIVENYFDEKVDTVDIQEAYENIYSEAYGILLEDINTKLSSKKDKYNFLVSILEAKKTIDLKKLTNTNFFKFYSKLNEKSPNSDILYFDWKNPTRVSLIESELEDMIFIEGNKEKALNMWSDSDFRKQLKESVKTLQSDVYNGQLKLIKIIESNNCLSLLDEIEFKTVISKALLMEDSDTTKSVKGIMKLYENFELGRTIKLLKEEGELPSQTAESPASEEKPIKPTSSELTILISKLKELNSIVKDEKANSFLDNLIKKIEDMKETNKYDANLLKEIVTLLTPENTVRNNEKKEEPVTDTVTDNEVV